MKRFAVPFLLLLMMITTSCGPDRQKVIIPPEAPMTDIHRIAVVGFDNYTSDPGVARLAQDLIVQILGNSGQYTMIDPLVVNAVIAEMGIERAQLAVPETAQAFGQRIQADALIIGEVLFYHETMSVSTPSCINCRVEGRTPSWSVTHQTSVSTSMRIRVIKTQTGAIIWSKNTEGKEQRNRYIDLSYRQHDAPPASLIPRPDNKDIPGTREGSVTRAVREFTKDLLPREIWVRVD